VPRFAGPVSGILAGVPFFLLRVAPYLIHALAVLVAIAFHQAIFLAAPRGILVQRFGPEGYGHGLGFIYLMWAVVIVILLLPVAIGSREMKQEKESVVACSYLWSK